MWCCARRPERLLRTSMHFAPAGSLASQRIEMFLTFQSNSRPSGLYFINQIVRAAGFFAPQKRRQTNLFNLLYPAELWARNRCWILTCFVLGQKELLYLI